MSKNKIKTYVIISPDGFTIDREATYRGVRNARKAYKVWAERYREQGYYSSVKYGKIDLRDLHEFCELKEIN